MSCLCTVSCSRSRSSLALPPVAPVLCRISNSLSPLPPSCFFVLSFRCPVFVQRSRSQPCSCPLSPVSSPAFSRSHPQQNRTPWLQGCFLCERGETVSGPAQNGKCVQEMPREQFWYIFGAVNGKCLPGGSHGARFVHFLVHGGKCLQEAPKEQFW